MKKWRIKLKRPLTRSNRVYAKFARGNFAFVGALGKDAPSVKNLKKKYERTEL